MNSRPIKIEPIKKTVSQWMILNKDRISLLSCPCCCKSPFRFSRLEVPQLIDCYLVQCNDCGFITYNPQPKNILNFYRTETRPQTHTFLNSKKNKMNRHKITLLKWIEELRYPVESLFDYGCSDGYLLKYFVDKYGTEVSGIELNRGHYNWAKYINKINISNDPLEIDSLITTGKKFDMVILYHVLEHLQDMSVFMNKIKSILRPDGYLYLALPTFDRLDYSYDYHRNEKHRQDCFYKDEHINFFDKILLEKFLNLFGLDVKYSDIDTYGTTLLLKNTGVISNNFLADDFKRMSEKFNAVKNCYESKYQMDECLRSGRKKEAIVHAEKALFFCDNFPELILKYAACKDDLDQQDYILDMINKKPYMRELYIDLGASYFRTNDFDHAEEWFMRAINNFYFDAQTASHVAYIHYHRGDFEQCIEWFKKLLDYDYDQGTVNVLGGILANL